MDEEKAVSMAVHAYRMLAFTQIMYAAMKQSRVEGSYYWAQPRPHICGNNPRCDICGRPDCPLCGKLKRRREHAVCAECHPTIMGGKPSKHYTRKQYADALDNRKRLLKAKCNNV